MSHEKPVRQTATLVLSSRQLGMWLFLATVTMLFAGLASALLVRSALPDWQAFAAPRLLGLNTLVLLLSSLCLELRQGKKIALLLATVLAGGFLIGQIVVWRQLMEAGVYIPSSPHAAFFYLFTGIHGIHLLGGFLFLGYLSRRSFGHRENQHDDELLTLGRTLWHFLTALWLLILGLLFLV